MKTDWLRKKLAEIEVPAPAPAAQDRALERALMALKYPERAEEGQKSAWGFLLPLSTLGLIAVLAAASLLVNGPTASPDLSRNSARQILDQIAATFPRQLEAVVESDGEMSLQLSSDAITPSSQPIEVLLTKGGESVRILSYSGREVRVQIDGQETSLELLAQGNGGVIVSGGNYFWSPEHPTDLSGYKVEASAL